jgi:hypothetical protein
MRELRQTRLRAGPGVGCKGRSAIREAYPPAAGPNRQKP